METPYAENWINNHIMCVIIRPILAFVKVTI